MTLRRSILALLVLALLAPATSAAEVRVQVREESLSAALTSAAGPAPLAFTMVGVHWQGPGEVWFRTASEPGRFGPWRSARPEDEDLPDLGTAEAGASAGWKVGNPWWTGSGRFIQYKVSGRVDRLRTYFISSPVTEADQRAAAGAEPSAAAATAAAAPPQPAMVRRAGWGADETIVRGSPAYADRVRLSVVHHTAGTNNYSASQARAIVRGIQRYHVLGNGWNDIGYNFLVDKYGKIYEGRAGGISRNVIGAHAQGFNTGSTGVAVLGTYGSSGISAAARAAVERLLAWRLDVAHVHPRSRLDFTSYGNERFPTGRVVRLRAVSGHRDTGYTSCPGAALYGRLGAIAQTVAGIGLPKLYDPTVSGAVGDLVRFTGRLSSARAWVVRVKNSSGTVVGQGSGGGAAIDWTWDAAGVPFGSYRYEMSAGSAVRRATGVVPSPPPLAITGVKASPGVLTPNGDGVGERTTVSYRLSRRATVTAQVVNASSGTLVRTLLSGASRGAGPRSVAWTGVNAGGAPAADGRYRIEISAAAGTEQVDRSVGVLLDRTLAGVVASPTVLSPNGDHRRDRLRVGFELRRTATVRVRIRRNGKTVRTILSGSLATGAHAAVWDGRDASGRRVSDGRVNAAVYATTSLGRRTLSVPLNVDTGRPVVRIVSLKMRNGKARVRFTLSEAAEVHIWLGWRTWKGRKKVVIQRKAGSRFYTRAVQAKVVRIVAFDAGKNRGNTAVRRR